VSNHPDTSRHSLESQGGSDTGIKKVVADLQNLSAFPESNILVITLTVSTVVSAIVNDPTTATLKRRPSGLNLCMRV
jgi:hypothetical protein